MTARPDTRELEGEMPSGGGELGMLRQEVFRLGKQLREDVAEIKLDLKEGLAALQQSHEKRVDDHETRIRELERKQEGLLVRVGVAGAIGAGIATPIIGAIVAGIAYAILHH